MKFVGVVVTRIGMEVEGRRGKGALKCLQARGYGDVGTVSI